MREGVNYPDSGGQFNQNMQLGIQLVLDSQLLWVCVSTKIFPAKKVLLQRVKAGRI
jgi:hypothetical protein